MCDMEITVCLDEYAVDDCLLLNDGTIDGEARWCEIFPRTWALLLEDRDGHNYIAGLVAESEEWDANVGTITLHFSSREMAMQLVERHVKSVASGR